MDDNKDCSFVNTTGFLRESLRTLQTDGLGSITSLTTEIGTFGRINVLTERYAYDSFGNLTITNAGPDGVMDNSDDVQLAESALGNPYFFTGREFDPESGLYYYRARYYDSQTGTFLQEDPLKGILNNPSTQHPYTYVTNNPLRFIDPSGKVTAVEVIAFTISVIVFVTTVTLIMEGTKKERDAQQKIRSKQGEVCSLEEFIELQEQFEDNRAEIIASGELEIIGAAAQISGASTLEGQAMLIGIEAATRVGGIIETPGN